MKATYRHIEVEPLTPGIGAIVHGVNLGEPVSEAVFEEIHRRLDGASPWCSCVTST